MTIPIGSGHGLTNVEGHEDFDIVWPWNQPGGLRRGATAVLRVKNEAPGLRFVLPPLLRACDAVLLVDNGSDDGTAAAVRAAYPQVEVVALPENLGAVGRNVGVARLSCPYVAFCDDDTWWDPGSLTRAADVLDEHPALAVLTARILVEPGGREDEGSRTYRRNAPRVDGRAMQEVHQRRRWKPAFVVAGDDQRVISLFGQRFGVDRKALRRHDRAAVLGHDPELVHLLAAQQVRVLEHARHRERERLEIWVNNEPHGVHDVRHVCVLIN